MGVSTIRGTAGTLCRIDVHCDREGCTKALSQWFDASQSAYGFTAGEFAQWQFTPNLGVGLLLQHPERVQCLCPRCIEADAFLQRARKNL